MIGCLSLYKRAQLDFSLNGFCFWLANPFIRKSSFPWSVQYFCRSLQACINEVSHADHEFAPSSPGSRWFCWWPPPSGAAQQVAAAAGVVAFFFRAETLGFATIYKWFHFHLLTSQFLNPFDLWALNPPGKIKIWQARAGSFRGSE